MDTSIQRCSRHQMVTTTGSDSRDEATTRVGAGYCGISLNIHKIPRFRFCSNNTRSDHTADCRQQLFNVCASLACKRAHERRRSLQLSLPASVVRPSVRVQTSPWTAHCQAVPHKCERTLAFTPDCKACRQKWGGYRAACAQLYLRQGCWQCPSQTVICAVINPHRVLAGAPNSARSASACADR